MIIHGLNAAGKAARVPFFEKADPAIEFVKVFQKYASIPPTGIWDATTHGALYTWVATVAQVIGAGEPPFPPKFGADPAATAAALDATGGMELFAEQTIPYSQDLLLQLGIPVGSVEETLAFVDKNRVAIESALDRLAAKIRTAEEGAASTGDSAMEPSGTDTGEAGECGSWWCKYKKPILIGGAVLGGLVLILLLTSGGSKEEERGD